jgi:DNA-binding NarL/FixJ family response regulator
MNNIQLNEVLWNQITPREKEIVEDLALGLKAKEVACKRGITLNTVEVHRHNILKKTKYPNTASLIAALIRGGCI